MNRPLPVTLVGGFLGAGKTSLLHHFLSEHAAGPVAILVESVESLGLDARALRGLCGAMRRSEDVVLEIPAHDESAPSAWLEKKLGELCREGRIGRVLVEISGTSNPARLAGAFERLTSLAHLQRIICVIDALDLYQTIVRAEPGQSFPFSDFISLQISSASLLVLNKCDLIAEPQRDACIQAIRRFNPRADLVETAYGELDAGLWQQDNALHLSSPENPHLAPAKDSFELSSAVYRAHRPFHPARFWDWFEADHPGLLRVKGLVWLATRNLLVGGISRSRQHNSCGGAGIWWAALPREEWPTDPAALQRMQQTWREPYGDRRQEFALVGEANSLPGITDQLAACLLTESEYARPNREWAAWPDPFPAWDVGEGG